MEGANENAMMRPSGLRKPNPIKMPQSPSRGLSEISESQSNSRMLPPPAPGQPNGLKHKLTGGPEPMPKQRKTLAEKAGEPIGRTIAAPPSARPVSTSVSKTLAQSASRVPSALTRTASTSNFGTSVPYGSRVPSAMSAMKSYGRPQTSNSHHRSASHNSVQRPATAQAQRSASEESAALKEKEQWDYESRFQTIESQFQNMAKKVEGTISEKEGLQESINQFKNKISELESIRLQLTTNNTRLQTELDEYRGKLSSATLALEECRRAHSFEVDDLRRKHRNTTEDLRDEHRRELEKIHKENDGAADKSRKDFVIEVEKLIKLHQNELAELQRKLKVEVEEEKSKRAQELEELQKQWASKLHGVDIDLDAKEREAQKVRGELSIITTDLERERLLKTSLQEKLSEATGNNITLEAANREMKAKIDFLESDNQAQSNSFAELHRRMQEAIESAAQANEKLRVEETLRRKLHNQVQELKGNIRVFCRVRPTFASSETEPANIAYPDCETDSKEVAVRGPEQRTALGNVTTSNNSFSFDRVFGPTSQNAEVFEEISQLVQSALDGYNVCIFCYGQTGSGKTYTMSSPDGMIPRAVQQIYAEATRLEEKGWKYRMEGSFVEVYNENINDLLGKSEDLDRKKLEIRHDTAKKQTIITDVTTVELDGPDRVDEMLKRASNNRSVAATKANERSSRSHSVFILKLVGVNSITGERSEGTLNLVDLAGSERLAHSQAQGERLKETQSINKSLSCLGDVINALGSAKENAHVPYRNSKLTYLLQYSLGGNSKTLMFVMVSPDQAHLQETITSLKFATKVHNTHIGTAKKQTKTKD
ncbi:kinesin-domain-containing protein [Mytilinidion resinicola]|uniref:Kinesin-like protein n=1 Tax=Mytilinidion resinicola TaxID=574789 RepID=A0A6A6Y452_9PEZI|nr:kinesin-domain-containing protein [Mytilinidion resinicola]KAF2803616.1 kinesin-domain-containing protein [Mytilinidion resinicola]